MVTHRHAQRIAVKRTVIRSVAALIGMFAFAFALVPLYDVFCQVTGLNGKVSNSAQQIAHQSVDEDRYVTVQFITRGSAGLPWQMSVANHQLRVNPGEISEINFTFMNHSDKESLGRAVPSVSPSEASQYLRKINCFCFDEQKLNANQKLMLPLVFQVVRELPKDINTITLVYTLYPVNGKEISLVHGSRDKKGDTI
ncbi:cytochrome c oxidase assembly protein [Halomonas vilamensis]|uniref:Cytochrome c oxidase assembly protein CtaG n=1 Tax=Vreelandella vilamensis TaxID=531309 RepID=A0ABU1H3E8_9GAMM|nr:cytochrome c oxidase assembly protein [Halomonas vilamensis]MDR5898371.1 cytochrome c oxidase assembly protein [Halomonas vilamensis]